MKLIELFRSLFNRTRRHQCQQQKPKDAPVELNQLPDLCLLAIFTRLPQADLITVGRVCTRWKSLVLEVSNKITSLTITIDNYGNWYGIGTNFVNQFEELLVNYDDQPTQYLTYDQKKYTKWNSLAFAYTEFNLSLVKQITDTFPNITSLELGYSGLTSYESLESLAHLLSHYHSQLISIKLLSRSKVKQLDCSPLFVSINRMPSPLRTLLVELGSPYDPVCLKDPEPLPIISQLERFCLNIPYLDKEQEASIKKAITTNANLRQVGLHFAGYELKISPFEKDFGSRVTHLVEPSWRTKYISYFLPYYCYHYPSVTNINVELCVFRFSSILKRLSSLRQLIHLKLKIDFRNYNSQEDEDEEKGKILLQLPSVKTIQFDLRKTKSFANFASLRIPYHFPSVQVIDLMFCGRVEEIPSDVDEVAIYDHLKTECSRLHHIYNQFELVWCR